MHIHIRVIHKVALMWLGVKNINDDIFHTMITKRGETERA